MRGFVFRKNSNFEWDGVTYRVREITPQDELVVEAIHSGAVSVVAQQTLLAQYANGRLAAAQPQLEAGVLAVYSRPFDELPETIRGEASRRLKYLRAIEAYGPPVFTRTYLEPILMRVSQEIGDKKPPGVSTVHRWFSRHRSAGRDARALVPRHDLRGSREPAQDKRVLELLAEATAEAFKASPLASSPNIHSRLLTKVSSENAGRTDGDKLVMPSLRTTYRLLKRASAYEKGWTRCTC